MGLSRMPERGAKPCLRRPRPTGRTEPANRIPEKQSPAKLKYERRYPS